MSETHSEHVMGGAKLAGGGVDRCGVMSSGKGQ